MGCPDLRVYSSPDKGKLEPGNGRGKGVVLICRTSPIGVALEEMGSPAEEPWMLRHPSWAGDTVPTASSMLQEAKLRSQGHSQFPG